MATHHFLEAMQSGFEGREEELGRSISTVLKTLKNVRPYKHEINDGLIKSWLISIQFAKNNNMLKQLVEHDIKTMEPVNKILKTLVEKSKNSEDALIGMFDHTACHYHMVLDTKIEPNKRIWTSPFKTVLDVSRRIKQFDLTEKEIHDNWTTPRILGYAETIGVKVKVSEWSEDGIISCEIDS